MMFRDLGQVALVLFRNHHVLIPPARAASSFSFRPPIGSTSPRKVISPVMATSARTGIRSARPAPCTCAIPALGRPSGLHPRGRGYAHRAFHGKSARHPSTGSGLRTTVIAAWIDSCITSPRDRSSPAPFTGTCADSMVKQFTAHRRSRPARLPAHLFSSSAIPKLNFRTPRRSPASSTVSGPL